MDDIKIISSKEFFGEEIKPQEISTQDLVSSLNKKSNKNYFLTIVNVRNEHTKLDMVWKKQSIFHSHGVVKYSFPLLNEKLNYEYGVQKINLKSIQENHDKFLEVIVRENEVIEIPFGLIYKAESIREESLVYKFFEERVCYRELVSFSGATLLGVPDFDSHCFEECDFSILGKLNLENREPEILNKAQEFFSMMKLGKLKISKGANKTGSV